MTTWRLVYCLWALALFSCYVLADRWFWAAVALFCGLYVIRPRIVAS